MQRCVVGAAAAVSEPVSRRGDDPAPVRAGPVGLGVVDVGQVPGGLGAVAWLTAEFQRVRQMRGALEPDAAAVAAAEAHAAESPGDRQVLYVPADRAREARIPERQV